MPAAVGLCALVATSAYGLDITMCGQSVPPGDVGVMTVDLISPFTSPAVALTDSTLDMQGHTITGGGPAVSCMLHCTILSSGGTPGTITGTGSGVLFDRTAIISNVHFMKTPANDSSCAVCVGMATGRADRIRLTNVTISGFAQVLQGTGVVGQNIQIDGCEDPFAPCVGMTRRIRFNGLVATGMPSTNDVLAGPQVRLSNTTVTGNQGVAIVADFVGLRNSVVTNNDQSGTGIDIDSTTRPRLFKSTCGLSHVFGGSGTWGVCTND